MSRIPFEASQSTRASAFFISPCPPDSGAIAGMEESRDSSSTMPAAEASSHWNALSFRAISSSFRSRALLVGRPGRCHQGGDVGVARLPAEELPGEGGRGDEASRVPGPAAYHLGRNAPARHAPGLLEELEDG